MERNRRYVVMGFGLGGNHGDGLYADGTKFSSQWYAKPEDLQEHIEAGNYSQEELEGCVLINKLPALSKNFGLAFESPMLDISLADGQCKRATDLLADPAASMVMSAIGALNPGIGLMAAKSLTDTSYIGLDSLCPTDYIEWWRGKGAVIGKVAAGKVAWEGAAQ